MIRVILVIMISFSAASFCSAQAPPDVKWSRTFGGPKYDGAYLVEQTSDGGYIIVGYTSSYGVGGFDLYIIKTDPNGIESWSKIFGGSEDDEAYSVQQTFDNGYIIAGSTGSFGSGDVDGIILKIDHNGNSEWFKTFGGTAWDKIYSIRQTSDNGFILAGVTESYIPGNSDIWLIKTDSEGNEEWNKRFGGPGYESTYSVRQTLDGGYITAGITESYGNGASDIYLIKINASGIMEWSKTFGGSSYDDAYSVQQTVDGGYAVAGETHSFGSGTVDAWLIKTDSVGNEEWNKTFGGSLNNYARSLEQTNDGGFIIAGHSESVYENLNAYIIKTDFEGNKEWSTILGGSELDRANSVEQTSDGGYVFVGETESYGSGGLDIWFVRLDIPGSPPFADFTIIPQEPVSAEPIIFDASGSYDSDGNIVAYGWDFGDGNQTTTIDSTITHVYTVSGSYLITLSVTDNSSKVDRTSRNIYVTSQIFFYALDLVKGYNTIAIPFLLTGYESAKDLIANIPYCIKLATWDTESERWIEVRKQGPFTYGDNFILSEDKGYFLLMSRDISYNVTGQAIVGPIIPELTNGLNLMRIYSPEKDITSHELLRDDPFITRIFDWDENSQTLRYTISGFFGRIIGDDIEIEKNKGYLAIYEDSP